MHFNFGAKNDIDNILANNINSSASLSSYKSLNYGNYLNNSNLIVKSEEGSDLRVVSDNFDEKNKVCKNELAVQVKNVTFGYDIEFGLRYNFKFGSNKNLVLNNCNLNVPRGKIYALLGSSGCGKTSLLRCILGRLEPQSGHIRVFRHKPNTRESGIPGPVVGYMPQDIALFGEFSISETLTYFGRLYKISEDEIKKRIDFLILLLNLPKKTKLVSQLSGGQQRRVSLSVALFHRPPLVILDEPTVGVDPVLREKIWEYLNLLVCQDNLTVIITTHYIEEARNASIVALMRDGRIIAENDPNSLMKYYKCHTLEGVFLKLCQIIDDKNNNNGNNDNSTDNADESFDMGRNFYQFSENDCESNSSEHSSENSSEHSSENSSEHSSENTRDFGNHYEHNGDNDYNNVNEKCKQKLNKKRPCLDFTLIKVLLIKNWINLSRNRLLFFMYFLPSLQLSFFYASVGQDPINLPVSVCNEESPPVLTSMFLDGLNDKIIRQTEHKSVSTAVESVRNGSAWVALHFSHNYTESFKTRAEEGGYADNQTIYDSNIHIYADMSNAVIGVSIFRAVLSSLTRLVDTAMSLQGHNPRSVSLPVHVEQVIYGTGTDLSIMEWMAPGMIIALVFFAPLALTIFAIVREKRQGLLERTLIAGVLSHQVVVSHFVIQSLVLFVEVFFMMITSFVLWNMSNNGSYLLAVCLTYLQGMTGVAFGLLVSAVCTNEITAMAVGSAIVFPSWMLCGVFWPVQSMNTYLQYFSYTLPLTFPVEAMRYILERGWSLSHIPVLLGFVVSGAYIIIFFILSIVLFKKFITSY